MDLTTSIERRGYDHIPQAVKQFPVAPTLFDYRLPRLFGERTYTDSPYLTTSTTVRMTKRPGIHGEYETCLGKPSEYVERHTL